MASNEYSLQITTKYMCAGLVVRNQTVISTAPILKYMKGWDVLKVMEYCQKKGWTCIEHISTE